MLKQTNDKKEKDLATGGQAIIEGVLMRSSKYTAMAVRQPDGSIVTKRIPLAPVTKRYKILSLPFIRGIGVLWDAMVIGIKALDYSARVVSASDEKPLTSKDIFFAIFLALLLAIGLFSLLPLFIADLFKSFRRSEVMFSLVEGIVRAAIFLIYIWIISIFKDVKRIFEYHGAEHKSIHTYEAGEELNVENARRHTTIHPRCGTSFLAIVLIVSIFLFSLLGVFGTLNFWQRLVTRLAFIPLIAGLTYELQRFTAKHLDSPFIKPLAIPGMWIQKITTAEPDDEQLQVGLVSLKLALGMEVSPDELRGGIYMGNDSEEFNSKMKKLRDFLKSHAYDALLLTKQYNFSWLTGGGTNRILLSTEDGVGAVLITKDKCYLIADNVERQRLLEEEMSGLEIVEAKEYRWYDNEGYESIVRALVEDKIFVSDSGIFGSINVDDEIAPLRWQLTPREVEKAKRLGKDIAISLESAMLSVEKGMSEHQIEILVTSQLTSHTIEPVLVLVGGEERAKRYRHILPKEKECNEYVIVSVCGRREGLVLSATRMLSFGKDEKLLEQHRKNCYVDAVAIGNTVVGKTLGDVFDKICKAYEEVGYPDEWKKHHQGGIAGYRAREVKAIPNSPLKIEPNELFAWNPTIAGTKSEDTILVTEKGFDILTVGDGKWPTLKFDVNGVEVERPSILVKES